MPKPTPRLLVPALLAAFALGCSSWSAPAPPPVHAIPVFPLIEPAPPVALPPRPPAPAVPAKAAAPAPAPASPAMAPMPYTAEQIRKATKTGRKYRFRLEVAGKPTVERTIVFTKVDDAGAELQITMRDAAGKPVGEPETSRTTWEELRKHAEFPASAVTITQDTAKVPAGKLACRVYTVKQGEGAEATVSRFYFANDLPGAPVLFYTDKGGARVSTSTLVEHKPGK